MKTIYLLVTIKPKTRPDFTPGQIAQATAETLNHALAIEPGAVEIDVRVLPDCFTVKN